MTGVQNLANGGSALAIGTYLVVVGLNGNAMKLVDLLKGEAGYVDFVVALFILGAIQKYGPAGKISAMLTGIALLGFLVKTMNGNGQITVRVKSAINDFANGKVGIVGGIREAANF